MSYTTLVHVDPEGELSGRVRVAAELAERFCAHLIGVAAWAPMAPGATRCGRRAWSCRSARSAGRGGTTRSAG